MDDSLDLKGYRRRWTARCQSENSFIGTPEFPLVRSENSCGDIPDFSVEHHPVVSVASQAGDELLSWDLQADEPPGWCPDLASEVLQTLDEENDPEHWEPLMDANPLTTPVLEVVASSSHEADWKRIAVESNAKRLRLDDAKLPWESGPFRGVFGTSDNFLDTCLANQTCAFTPVGIGLHDVLHSQAVASRALSSSASSVVEEVQRIAAKGARRERPDEDIRRLALDKLHDLILSDLPSTQLGVSLADLVQSGGDSDLVTQSLKDCFRMKSSSTLQKRASSLVRMKRILLILGVTKPPLRINEAELYAVLCHLRGSGSGATSGQHLLEALFFLDGTVKLLACNVQQVVSGRCRGIARDLHLTKAPLNQKAAFRVNHVRFLEQIIHDLSSVKKCMVGQVLFCIHSCS